MGFVGRDHLRLLLPRRRRHAIPLRNIPTGETAFCSSVWICVFSVTVVVSHVEQLFVEFMWPMARFVACESLHVTALVGLCFILLVACCGAPSRKNTSRW